MELYVVSNFSTEAILAVFKRFTEETAHCSKICNSRDFNSVGKSNRLNKEIQKSIEKILAISN